MKLHCIAKHIGAFAFLIFILLVAGWIRIQGIPEIPEGQFTSSDAYFYYRQVSIITDQGKLPERDMHRWLPLGRDLEQTLPFYSYVLAYVHKALALFFPDVSLYNVVLFAPVVFFVLGMGILCLFLYWVFGFDIAVIVGLLLALLPGSVDRSSAGFSDRDSWCLLLGILAIITYLWKEQIQRPRHRFLFTALSGFFCVLGRVELGGFRCFYPHHSLCRTLVFPDIRKGGTFHRIPALGSHVCAVALFVFPRVSSRRRVLNLLSSTRTVSTFSCIRDPRVATFPHNP